MIYEYYPVLSYPKWATPPARNNVGDFEADELLFDYTTGGGGSISSTGDLLSYPGLTEPVPGLCEGDASLPFDPGRLYCSGNACGPHPGKSDPFDPKQGLNNKPIDGV